MTIIGDGSGTPVTVAGDKLTSADDLKAKGSEIPMPGAIQASRGTLGDKLFGWEGHAYFLVQEGLELFGVH